MLAQLVGQKLMVAMSGTTPSADLLGRIERGEIGGVILFSFNISTAGQLRALTKQLAQAAAAGGQPPLLIATDQEGGLVKRVAWAPPTLSPPEIGDLGDPSTAESRGPGNGLRPALRGDQHQPRARRGRPEVDRVVHVRARPDVVVRRIADGDASPTRSRPGWRRAGTSRS